MLTTGVQFQRVPPSHQFFEEQTAISEIKARIVSKYFYAWASVMSGVVSRRRDKRIAYIDLFAGPGAYSDGTPSTPLLVLQRAIEQPRTRASLVTYFNDGNPEHAKSLRKNINLLPGVRQLSHEPKVTSREVNEEFLRDFRRRRLPPSFTFIDPFGYKELSLDLIECAIKDWGCDCVFFFNYRRVNAAINNPVLSANIDRLYGSDRADALRKSLPSLNAHLRQATILDALVHVIKQLQPTAYALPFIFRSEFAERTSHMLIFVSKHFKGYSIMKEIMASESSARDQGVPSFAYSVADASTPLLLPFTQPLSDLRSSLLKRFASQERNLEQIYEAHSPDTPFIEKNYRVVLNQLEREGVIRARSTRGQRKPDTYPAHVLVKFPASEHHGD